MPCCPVCQGPVPQRHSRGPLTTQIDPPMVWWHGKPLKVPRGYAHAILHLLCGRQAATSLAVQMVGAGEDAGPTVACIQITKLRHILPPEVKITAIHGWGYQLDILEPEGE